ncbi:sulfite exporter TauE/SafE family protein [Fructilactobacillus sanfranciscensis]|uniref:Probable membrane transporter protein n=1 Tax=Fructilactobacillus sanfranciscensis TaxID=1625 RepID=A0A5C4TL06_FRUSA|nr:sulfite exporter TauE/SafE family protein [Fructilactobacillus sanfranciscensis]MDN4462674.1 sulfite exporter TauE/SafE family protein [Fructilactobacillus sanfranciscensis]NDR60097.1 sulfite exporter TauE/SafE family protein [Fructilactobacillus sanfranciscensis]NDR62088.1 sulfite exporter TauE/SafE family protein [Fructilactobacillus sanfranciscensis]NDR69802.1 sulfite exporter TauE/SafE family protein [Fructilactobacillus sanfranciscensis]NDR77284.1 sulfite exporter TauE/SafE family prot
MLLTILFLIVAGFFAGLLATIAGLASIVSYPALLIVGIPPVVANVSNTVALISTGLGAIPASMRELKGQWHRVMGYTILAVIGSFIGSSLLLIAPASTFEKVVPFFILSAGILLIISGRGTESNVGTKLKRDGRNPHKERIIKLISYFGIVFVGGYLGYFGAAGGVVLLAILGVITHEGFAEYNAVKNFMCCICNVAAMLLFIFKATIDWAAVVPLGIGLLIGGYTGPLIVRHVNVKMLRMLIAIASFVLAGYLGYKAYL